jgi:hypothetical protein
VLNDIDITATATAVGTEVPTAGTTAIAELG